MSTDEPTSPPWIEPLRSDDALNEALELTWAETSDQASLRNQWLSVWDQVPFDADFHAQCRARIERSTPLATGLRRYRRLSMTESTLVLMFDPEAPEVPWVSLSVALPPALWIRGATTGPQLLERLAPYTQPERTSLRALPKTLRLFKPIQIEDRSTVLDAINALELWLDDATWENGHEDDPWVGVESNPSMLQLRGLKEHAQLQSPSRFPSTGLRSLWSHSALIIEQLPFNAWIFEVHYTPVDNGDTLRMVEQMLGTQLATHDMPVDLVASLLREATLRPEAVDEHCQTEPDAALAKLSIEPAEPTSFALLEGWLERHIDNEELLSQLAELASLHHYDSLLFELALSQPADSDLRRDLESFLRPHRPEATAGGDA